MDTSQNPRKVALRSDWVLRRIKSLSDFTEEIMQSDDSAEYCLRQILTCLKLLREKIITQGSEIALLAAADATIDRLVALFDLTIPSRADAAKYEYKLPSEPTEVPTFLTTALTRLDQTNSDSGPMTAAGTGVDCLLMEVREHMNSAPASSAPRPAFTILPELDLRHTLIDPATQQPLEISGRADWAFGYGTRTEMTRFAVVVQARADTFSAAYVQLLMDLAIVRQRGIQERAKHEAVCGFFTDGVQYRFVMIKEDGMVVQSRLYEVFLEGQLKTIFNFVLQMAEGCSPDLTPVGAGAVRKSGSSVAPADSAAVREDEGYYILPMKG